MQSTLPNVAANHRRLYLDRGWYKAICWVGGLLGWLERLSQRFIIYLRQIFQQ